MEDQRQYCLKWNNHPTNISSVFDRLRSEELFVDVTLASQDRQVIRAHRCLLSAGSGYLEKVLALAPSDHPTVVLCHIKYKELKLLVDFMYSGEIAVDQQQFPVLLEAAKSLRIRGLYEESEAESSNDEEASKEPKQNNVGIDDKTISELSVTCNETANKINNSDKSKTIKNECLRKRSHSEESEEEPIQSPISINMADEDIAEVTPSKVFKPMYGPMQGVSNPFWMMSQDLKGSENTSVECTKSSEVPNLMNLVSQANLLQQKENNKQASENIQNAQKINEHFLQAMQMCTNPYLSTVAALQNQKPLDLLSCTAAASSFTSNFPQGLSPTSTKSSSPNSKSSMISNAPVRRYKQYTEDSLQAALKEIMNGQSINRSSMKHNIPARTLRDWMKRLNIKSVFTHHSHNKSGSQDGDRDQESSASESPEPGPRGVTSPVFGASTGPIFPPGSAAAAAVGLMRHSGSVFPGMTAEVKDEDEIDDDEPKTLRIDETPLGSLTQIAQEAN